MTHGMAEIKIGDEVIIEEKRSPSYGDVGIVAYVGELTVGVQLSGGCMVFKRNKVSK